MSSATLLVCAVVAIAYFGYAGSKLPRIPMTMRGDWLMERDEEMGFVPTRNGSTEIRSIDGAAGFHVFTDRRSARVNAPGAETGDTVDVMALGCSFTWGAGVESEATWPQQLGGLLDASVANLAMGSFGSVQAYLMLLRNSDLHPKVVVYGFIPDHLRRNLAPCAPNYVPYCAPVAFLKREGDQMVLQPPPMHLFSPEDNRDFMAEVALRDPTGPTAFLLRTKWAAKMAWFRWRDRPVPVDDPSESGAVALRVMLGAMAEQARKIGAAFVVLHMPYLTRGASRTMPPELAAAVSALDLTVVDFGPVVADYYQRDPVGTLVVADTDAHPNPVAHRLIAETLGAAVGPLLAVRR